MQKPSPLWNLTLAQKGALLIALPVAVQLILLSVFYCLRSDADGFALRAGLARDVSLSLRDVILKDTSIILLADEAIEHDLVLAPGCRSELVRLSDEAARLKQLWADSPENCLLIEKLVTKTTALLGLIRDEAAIARSKELLKQREHLHIVDKGGKELDAAEPTINSQARTYKLDMLGTLFSLTQNLPAATETVEQAQSRKMYLIAAVSGSLLNMLALLLMALFFSRDIITRLKILNDNSLRLSRGQRLLPVLTGKDEIAQLDNAFHEMVASLTKATRNQRALFENAHDVLCYVDRSRRFSGVNNASTKVLGYSAKELIGTCVEDIVVAEDRQATINHMSQIISARAQAPFEMRILRKDGMVIHMVLSGRFVPEEGTMFCVLHDISNRKAAEQLRKDVVRMVSQDLLSPLSAIDTIYDTLESSRFGELNEKGKRQLHNVRTNIDRMLQLINDLLDIEKLTSGSLELERRQVSLSTVIEQSIESVLFLADKKQLKIDRLYAYLEVYADPHRLVQILVNLLSNAIKFSPVGGKITVSARRNETNIEISVTDEGRGIPKEMTKVIFNRFQQVKTSDATVKGGSGLGLAICKELVELHGGQIGVESEEGNGSRFYFFIPR